MSELGITVLDLAVVAIVLLSALLAMTRGVVREGLGILTWVGAFAVAWFTFAQARPWVFEQVGHPLVADLATVLVVFVGPLIVFKVLGSIVAGGVEGSFLGPVNRALGLVFGAARGAFLVVVAYLIGSVVVPPEHHPAWVTEAAVLPVVQEGAAAIAGYLPEDVIERSQEQAIETAERAAELRETGGYENEATRAVDDLIERSTR